MSKKSYMNVNSLLSEGLWDDFKSYIRKNQVNDIIKKVKNLENKEGRTAEKLQTNIDKLNKAMQDFDKQLAKDYGIKSGKSPNITIDDFVK